MSKRDVLGIGNAIVDVIAQVPEAFLTHHSLQKGAMTLITEAAAEDLLGHMGEPSVIAGGSAANTVIGAAALGCRASFVGRVRDDRLGAVFVDGMRRAEIDFPVQPADGGPTTARCYILVTPDGQRTMNTYLGACQDLDEGDIRPAEVEEAEVIYLEGYLWDPPAAKAAFLKAATIAHAANRKVALSLSDAFCVDRYRSEFLDLLRDGTIDILFANEAELKSLYHELDFDRAIAQLLAEGVIGAVTRSEHGCVVFDADGMSQAIPAAPVAQVVDTTGAGDLFASGFITGLIRGLELSDCARLGGLAAAEIIQHLGARPQSDIRALAVQHGLRI